MEPSGHGAKANQLENGRDIPDPISLQVDNGDFRPTPEPHVGVVCADTGIHIERATGRLEQPPVISILTRKNISAHKGDSHLPPEVVPKNWTGV